MNDQITEIPGSPKATLTIDLADLLAAGRLIDEDEDGEPIFASSFIDQIIKRSADLVVKEVMRDTYRKALEEQVSTLVHERIAAALDRDGIVERDIFGNPKGPTKTMGEYLADKAAEEVGRWMKGDRYDRSKFADFLSREVDAAVRADLKGVVEKARADIKARMEAAGAKAIADAAASMVREVTR
jgi:hypothetical protein